MDGKHGQTMSGVTCHHRLWTTHTVERCRVWLYITALGLHAWSDDIGRGMTSPPFDSTHGRMTSGEARHHHLWQHTRSDYVGRGMTSPPLESTHGRTTSGVTCHHRLWTAHSVERRRMWHDIIAVGQHTWSNDIGRGMTSPPFDCTHDRTTSSVASYHRPRTTHTVE